MLLPILQQVTRFQDSPAFRSATDVVTGQQLLKAASANALALLQQSADLGEARVGLLVPADHRFPAALWGVWQAGGIAVPMCLSATDPEWEYCFDDAGVSAVLTSAHLLDRLRPLCEARGIRLLCCANPAGDPPADLVTDAAALPAVSTDRRAMILYTSGTTSRPKGVVTTHACIQAQIESLVQAWDWQSTDRIPLFLPLHHIHGIINVVSCALYCGALIEPFDGFEPQAVLQRLQQDAFTVFMAVPTIYVRLIRMIEQLPPAERQSVCRAFARLRLMVSGSAALPASVHAHWYALTGQMLLERYGMTEIGMALSNPLRGERRPGAVGVPLPGVDAMLYDEHGGQITEELQPGEIRIRGAAVFREYWQRPEATASAFRDGWFCTGDVAVLEQGYFRILGRQSVDIIKSGGYKLSALEIEATLLEHPAVRECAVVGLADETWGEAVAAAMVLQPGCQLELPQLKEWCRERLSYYKLPKQLLICEALPRNAMGKVVKPQVQQLFTQRSEEGQVS